MMLTEKEAAGKWCPFYRVATSGGDQSTFETDNRPREWIAPPAGSPKDAPYTPGKILAFGCCLGSGCMAWRETAEYRADTNQETVKGHCGLAGSP
jgi:hypothetical protein